MFTADNLNVDEPLFRSFHEKFWKFPHGFRVPLPGLPELPHTLPPFSPLALFSFVSNSPTKEMFERGNDQLIRMKALLVKCFQGAKGKR